MGALLLIVVFFCPSFIFAGEGQIICGATYYTVKSCQTEGTSGLYTASGEKFDESAFTCAMRRRDWGSTWRVTNVANGRTIIVRLNDFGPGRGPTAKGVGIDLTPAGFKALGAKPRQGRIEVKIERIKKGTIDGII